MNGGLLWAVGASVLALTAVIGIAILMHALRDRLDNSGPADEHHLFDHPVPYPGPVHTLEQGCWCVPDVQLRDGTTYVLHRVTDEGDHP